MIRTDMISTIGRAYSDKFNWHYMSIFTSLTICRQPAHSISFPHIYLAASLWLVSPADTCYFYLGAHFWTAFAFGHNNTPIKDSFLFHCLLWGLHITAGNRRIFLPLKWGKQDRIRCPGQGGSLPAGTEKEGNHGQFTGRLLPYTAECRLPVGRTCSWIRHT